METINLYNTDEKGPAVVHITRVDTHGVEDYQEIQINSISYTEALMLKRILTCFIEGSEVSPLGCGNNLDYQYIKSHQDRVLRRLQYEMNQIPPYANIIDDFDTIFNRLFDVVINDILGYVSCGYGGYFIRLCRSFSIVKDYNYYNSPY